ncbi:hypothetical protein BB561_002550 [Smittium simulii]|uniref:Uncharacterized protein n=1 Tax=Smittium simulii TaxID=133385 RepID=A0A2T9YQ33_9FUNG|nr:hypothetical protein BB561_002550 [Smittium simulii]
MLIRSVLLPKATYGGELFGMSIARSTKLQSIIDNVCRAVMGCGSSTALSRLRDKLKIATVNTKTAVARERAYYKWPTLNTWMPALMAAPMKSRLSTWVSGTTKWVKRYCQDKVPGQTAKALALRARKNDKSKITAWIDQIMAVVFRDRPCDLLGSTSFKAEIKFKKRRRRTDSERRALPTNSVNDTNQIRQLIVRQLNSAKYLTEITPEIVTKFTEDEDNLGKKKRLSGGNSTIAPHSFVLVSIGCRLTNAPLGEGGITYRPLYAKISKSVDLSDHLPVVAEWKLDQLVLTTPTPKINTVKLKQAH